MAEMTDTITTKNVVLLLFGSGKLVITGANRFADLELALVEAHARLEELGLLD